MNTGGRGVTCKKMTVDEVRYLDILELQRANIFNKAIGTIWTITWSFRGKKIASIAYKVEADREDPTALRFIYTITDKDTGKKQNFNYSVSVVATPCYFGGKRWWFICPLVANGQACQRRCRIIYLPPGAEYFGCRECHRLTYESRQRHREKFYEGFSKPYKVVKAALEKLDKVRSWKKKEKIWRKLFRAQAAIKNFDNIFNSRKSKIIYMEK